MSSKSMKAIVPVEDGFSDQPAGTGLQDIQSYVELKEVPIPEPKAGQVLIKVIMASVNPSDLAYVKGRYSQSRVKGRPAGFEGVGEVAASGGGMMANRLKGKRVAFATTSEASGAWAEYALAEAATCIPLNGAVRDEDGASMMVNPLSALAMLDIVRHEGAKAFVMTAGGSQLNKLLIKAASEEGFRPIAIIRRAEQVEALTKLGAAAVLNAKTADYEEKLAAVMKAEQPRILFDAVAGPGGATVFEAMPDHARWIIYGRLDPTPPTLEATGHLIFRDKHIEGFWLTSWMKKASIFKKLSLVRNAQKRFMSGRWRTDVTAKIPLGEAMSRLPGELEKPDGKVFIVP